MTSENEYYGGASLLDFLDEPTDAETESEGISAKIENGMYPFAGSLPEGKEKNAEMDADTVMSRFTSPEEQEAHRRAEQAVRERAKARKIRTQRLIKLGAEVSAVFPEIKTMELDPAINYIRNLRRPPKR